MIRQIDIANPPHKAPTGGNKPAERQHAKPGSHRKETGIQSTTLSTSAENETTLNRWSTNGDVTSQIISPANASAATLPPTSRSHCIGSGRVRRISRVSGILALPRVATTRRTHINAATDKNES